MKRFVTILFLLFAFHAVADAAGNDIPCLLGTTGQTCTIAMSSKVQGASASNIWTTQATSEDPAGVYTANYAAGLDATKAYFVTCTCGATVWLYTYDITETRVDTAVSAGAGLSGDYQTTATVYVTATTTPIPDYSLSVYDSTNTVFQGKIITNASGVAAFNLDAGTYKIRGRKAGYSAASATETLVVAADGTATFYAAAYTITAPASADVCRVYEWITAQDGETIPATVKATAQIVSLPYNYGGRLMAGSIVNGTYNATTGLLYWDVVKGAMIEVKIPVFGYDKQKVVPTDATKRLSDIQ